MRRRLYILLTMILVGVTTFAQTLKVKGIVVDENNEAVIGASILVKGSNTGTKTDINGQFELSGIKSGAKLDVSYIGMKSQTVTAKTEMKIVLENDDQVLDEVMVVAFGEQKKSSFTGSAGVVDSKKLEQRQVTNVMEALQGNVAGLQAYSHSLEAIGRGRLRLSPLRGACRTIPHWRQRQAEPQSDTRQPRV